MIVDGAEGWYISAESCVRATVDNVENNIAKSNQRLHIHCKTLIMYGYWPETSTSLEIKYEGVTQYQERVGLLRWSVELGQVCILLETELMSIYLSLPCRGYLEQLFHVFGYLKADPKRNICFDPQHTTTHKQSFAVHGWYGFYRDVKEDILEDASTTRGNLISTHCFVDADHAGDRYTRRSQTWVLIFVNKSPILWYSKQHSTVKTSKFLSEFITLKTATELVEALCYKLCMFDIPIYGPSNMF